MFLTMAWTSLTSLGTSLASLSFSSSLASLVAWAPSRGGWWRSSHQWAQGRGEDQGGHQSDQRSQGGSRHGQKHHKPRPWLAAGFIHVLPGFGTADYQRSRRWFCPFSPPYFSLGFKLSNKTNCSPIGVHLLGHFQAKPDRCPYRGQSRAPGRKLPFGGNSTAYWLPLEA